MLFPLGVGLLNVEGAVGERGHGYVVRPEGLLCAQQEVPLEGNGRGELVLRGGDGEDVLGGGSDGSAVEEDLQPLCLLSALQHRRRRLLHAPSVSFTTLSFQKRFLSRPLGLLEGTDSVRTSCACFTISAWRFFLATRSNGSDGCGVGFAGGGPGTEACGSGVAWRAADVCRH